jgi:hypothetical protein
MAGKEVRLWIESEVTIVMNDDENIDEIVDSLFVDLNSDAADLLDSLVTNYKVLDSKDI